MSNEIEDLRAQIIRVKEIAVGFVKILMEDELEISNLRDEIARLRARIDTNAIEYDRLLSRCAALEHVRQQAQALLDYTRARSLDSVEWMRVNCDQKFEALGDAIKEAPP